MAKRRVVTVAKAKKILQDGTIRGKPLTKPQRGFFGIIAGGGTPRKSARRKSHSRRGR